MGDFMVKCLSCGAPCRKTEYEYICTNCGREFNITFFGKEKEKKRPSKKLF